MADAATLERTAHNAQELGQLAVELSRAASRLSAERTGSFGWCAYRGQVAALARLVAAAASEDLTTS